MTVLFLLLGGFLGLIGVLALANHFDRKMELSEEKEDEAEDLELDAMEKAADDATVKSLAKTGTLKLSVKAVKQTLKAKKPAKHKPSKKKK